MDKLAELVPRYPNNQDGIVLERLCNAPLSTLPTDEFAPAVYKGVTPQKEDSIVALRLALAQVYIRTISIRFNAKAIGKHITSGNRAATSLMQAIHHLSAVEPFPSWGSNAALAAPCQDPKGLLEARSFNQACWDVKLSVVSTLMRLIKTLDQEEQKFASNGERKKRLRILVEGLADWWESTGGSIAPYVKAKRRDNAPSVVIGRFGDFASLSIAVFCKLDDFSESEVLATITNVHKARLAAPRGGSAQ